MAAKTISHCQGKGSLSHNNRKFQAKNVDSSRTADNVTFVEIPIKQAYDDCFGAAIERYNTKQKRSDRKIKDGYFQYAFGKKPCDTVAVASDKRKSFYEDVVQIGTKDDTGVGSADAQTVKECLTEYMSGFAERSPNFFVFNAVLHMDEATPHLHIDYIPIAHCKRGLDTQNGMAMALKEMGFGEGKDAISRWRERERKILVEICKRHGIEISAPEKSRGSFDVDEYKRYKDNISELKQQEKDALQRAAEAEKKAKSAEVKLAETNAQYEAATRGLERVLNEKARAAEIKSPHLFSKTVKYDAEMLDSTRAIGYKAAANLLDANKKEQANAVREQQLNAREQRLNEMAADIVPLHEQAENFAITAQEERDQARELRENQESYIRGTARKMAQKMTEQRINEIFGDISDERGKRLEAFCEQLKFSDGTNALQAFEKQEKALLARSRGRGR